jgi:hypothetical protein
MHSTANDRLSRDRAVIVDMVLSLVAKVSIYPTDVVKGALDDLLEIAKTVTEEDHVAIQDICIALAGVAEFDERDAESADLVRRLTESKHD